MSDGYAIDHMEAFTPPRSAMLTNAEELRQMRFPPVRYIVPGYIAEGCTLLAGRPKLGKSWLVLEVGLAVASGGTCLGGIPCEQGDVLYLALEDPPRRLQKRIDKMLGPFAKEWPKAFDFATEWSLAGDNGLDEIRSWIRSKPNPRLIIVDVLAAFRSARGGKESLYEADYAAIKGLQNIASEFNIAIVVVHHVRKSQGENAPFEKISGTLGLSGAADTALILDRESNGATLYGRGRDIEEIESAVIFDRDSCRWIVQGEAADVRRTDERSTILSVLLEADASMSPTDLSDATGMPNLNIRQLIFKMVKAGEIEKCGRGRYRHPDRADSGNNQYPRNNDNKLTNPGVYRRSHDGEGDDD